MRPRISGRLKPSDILEEIWVRDVVDLTWEVFRLRRLKANLMTAAAYEGLARVLQPLLRWKSGIDRTAEKWAARDQGAVKKVDTSALTSAGLTKDAIMASTLALRIDDIERIDRMTLAAEGRRHAVLRRPRPASGEFCANASARCPGGRGRRVQGHRAGTTCGRDAV